MLLCFQVGKKDWKLWKEPHFQQIGWYPFQSPSATPCRHSSTRNRPQGRAILWWSLRLASMSLLPCSSIYYGTLKSFRLLVVYRNTSIHTQVHMNIFTCGRQKCLAKTRTYCWRNKIMKSYFLQSFVLFCSTESVPQHWSLERLSIGEDMTFLGKSKH